MITYGLVKQNSAYARPYPSFYDAEATNVTRMAPKYPFEMQMGYADKSDYAKRLVIDGEGEQPRKQKLQRERKETETQQMISALGNALLFSNTYGRSQGVSQGVLANGRQDPPTGTLMGEQTEDVGVGSIGENGTQTDGGIPIEGGGTQTEGGPLVEGGTQTDPDNTLQELENQYNETQNRANQLLEQLNLTHSAYLQTKDMNDLDAYML